MAVDPTTWFQGESPPAPEPPPAPSAPAAAEAPAPVSAEAPTPSVPEPSAPPAPGAETPPAPTVPPAPAPAPVAPDPEFVQAAQQLQEHRTTLQGQWQQLATQEQADYQATALLQGRLSEEEFAREVAAYQGRRAQREAQNAKLQAGWSRLDALDHELGVEWQRRQERAGLLPFAEAVTPLLAAQQYAAKWTDPTTPFPAQEFMQRIAGVPAAAFQVVADREFEALRRETALKRQVAQVDHMGGAGGGAGGGLDYTQLSSAEMAAKAADTFFANR